MESIFHCAGSADKAFSGVELSPCQGVPEYPRLENKVEIGVYSFHDECFTYWEQSPNP